MVQGKVEIFLSVDEPEDKNLLWLRPRRDREGYDLFYYGSCGWMPLIDYFHPHHHHGCGCGHHEPPPPKPEVKPSKGDCMPPYEINPCPIVKPRKPCGCGK